MEHWHTTAAPPYQREPGDLTLTSRVLTSSSGNIQSYNPDLKDGIENQDPLGLPRAEPWLKPEVHYPIPKVKLGSNDAHAENLAHLQHRRQNHRDKFFRRRRIDVERPYLQNQKYLQYRTRQRCDTGPDGKPVWDDRVEDAFQNGIVQLLLLVQLTDIFSLGSHPTDGSEKEVTTWSTTWTK
jgi:transcriptional enhancer factor